jgi:hypothetical protein
MDKYFIFKETLKVWLSTLLTDISEYCHLYLKDKALIMFMIREWRSCPYDNSPWCTPHYYYLIQGIPKTLSFRTKTDRA